MTIKTITVRELQRDMTAITRGVKQGKKYLVVRHSKPVFSITAPEDIQPKTYTLDDIANISFKGGGKLSQNIDQIVY